LIYDDEHLFHIYLIKDDATDEILYVGCTLQSLDQRLYQHCHDKRSAVHDVISCHGEENVSIVLLKDYYGTQAEAHFLEQEFTEEINKNNKLYNKCFGDQPTEETKAKLKKPRKKSHGVEVLLKHHGGD